MDTSLEYLFDDYFDNINLNNELKDFYRFINDEELNESFDEETKLIDIRNDNYKRYNDINMMKIENLSDDFEGIVNEIKKIYSFISPDELLNNNISEATNNKKIIDSVYNYFNQLYEMVQKKLTELENENNTRQNKIKQLDYNSVDKKTLEQVLNKYNSIVLYNSTIEDNVFDNYKRQLRRKKDLNKLYKLINLEIDVSDKKTQEIDRLNETITEEIEKIYNKISYLEDLMMEKSKYESEFLVFKDYFVNLLAFDDNNYSDISRVYNSLCKDLKLKSLLDYFEESFIKEIEDSKNEEIFIYEKYGMKNIKTSLDYISANYMNFINNEQKQIINNLYETINNDTYNIDEVYNELKKVVSDIWVKSITNVYSYKEKDDFCFICTNNQFIDEKHQAILITKKMLERVMDYSDYQIGFICDFNNNLLYVTENDDIMTVEYNDMSNLKTPKQIEQEFINFKVCNRIALNGYITKVSAVYFINDGDSIKYRKAVELANQYDLPLIVLKKDKN